MKFHIIQPVVVNQKSRSPACASTCRCSIFRCSSRIPPWRLHDRLRQPGRAGGVEDPQRVVERHALERQRARRAPVSDSQLSSPRTAVKLEPRHRVGDRRQRLRAVELAAVVAVARAPPAAPSARSARSGRSRCARRSPASSSTTPRPATRTPGTPPRSRGCSACRRRRGRRARRPARAARPRSARVSARSSPQVHSTSVAVLAAGDDRQGVVGAPAEARARRS